jgi:Predicted pPIWI-associating nuclease
MGLGALTQDNVATRAQHFSVSARALSEHMLQQFAPDDEAIKRCAWYEQNPNLDGPTRRHRAPYVSRRGLTDAFLESELKLEPKDFHSEIGRAFKERNNRMHLKPDTVITDPITLEELANETIEALLEISDIAEQVR